MFFYLLVLSLSLKYFCRNKLTAMRQVYTLPAFKKVYTLPAFKKVLRLNKNKESIKIVFWDIYNICLAHITQIVS